MTELELYQPPAEVDARRRWVELMKPAADLAKSIAGTDFVPGRLRQNPAAIAACVLYGDEVGLGPMQALAKIAVIDGRPSMSAEAMRSLILAAGHDLWVEEQTISKVTIAGKRRDSQQITRVTWTLDDARRAGLAGKPNWRTYPRQMLAARATAELARLVFADAIGGLQATEELEGELERESEPAAEKTGNGRRRRRRQPTASAAPPTPAALPRPDDEASTLPPLPGEPGYDQGSDQPSEAQRRKLHAIFRERGLDREQRLAWATDHLGRDLASFNDLTLAEASTLIDALQADDIPFGAPDTPAAPVEHLPVSFVIFKARLAQAGFDDQLVQELGHELFPERSLAQLSDEERGQLLTALQARREEEDA